jgi:hypothetical protein
MSHVEDVVHSVTGAVFATHAPWLQTSPAGHEPLVQAAAQEPWTQYGEDPEQLALLVQVVAEGIHAPPVHVEPAAHAVAGHPTTHWPFAHTFPAAQSLV